MSGEETRHRYAFGYQFTHLTREKDCLGHDDRLDAVAGAVSSFAEMMGGGLIRTYSASRT